jgi:hypothetical protein
MVSLVAAGGMLIALNERGTLAVLEESTSGYKEISSARVLNNVTWTPPVLCRSRIYCRNVIGELICIDMRNP